MMIRLWQTDAESCKERYMAPSLNAECTSDIPGYGGCSDLATFLIYTDI